MLEDWKIEGLFFMRIYYFRLWISFGFFKSDGDYFGDYFIIFIYFIVWWLLNI